MKTSKMWLSNTFSISFQNITRYTPSYPNLFHLPKIKFTIRLISLIFLLRIQIQHDVNFRSSLIAYKANQKIQLEKYLPGMMQICVYNIKVKLQIGGKNKNWRETTRTRVSVE